MKIKTSELTGAALDWAVAVCKGYEVVNLIEGIPRAESHRPEYGLRHKETGEEIPLWRINWHPSTNWEEGGPIIDRIEGFELKCWLESKPDSRCEAHIHNYEGNWVAFGPTPLIAAMRCYVASKLGDEIEIPEELCTT